LELGKLVQEPKSEKRTRYQSILSWLNINDLSFAEPPSVEDVEIAADPILEKPDELGETLTKLAQVEGQVDPLVSDLITSKAQFDMENKENIDTLGTNLVKNNYLNQNAGKIKATEFSMAERKRLAQCTKEAFLSKIPMVSSVVQRFAGADVSHMAESALEKLKHATNRYSVQLETSAQKIVNEYAMVAGSLNSTVAMIEVEND